MCRIKRLLCQLVIFAFVLSSVPASAHLCLHAMQGQSGKSAIEKTAEIVPPCHQQAAKQDAAQTKQQGKMDCCGDTCTCAAGTCAGTNAFLGMKADSFFIAFAAVGYPQSIDHFLPYMPEQATPPPRA